MASSDRDIDALADKISDIRLSRPGQVLPSLDLRGVAELIRTGDVERILVLSGAGISTSCGIPDFRTPGTGLYDNLEKFDLPFPEAVFHIDYLKKHPDPFFLLARELYPGKFVPSITHQFLVMLAKKGLLLRHYTQNIDCLDQQAGLAADLVVEAHGSFASATCMKCDKHWDSADFVRDCVFQTPPVIPKCPKCKGLVKPDIVFFGESLPRRFHTLLRDDVKRADLIIVMGTSLTVHPVAGIPEMVGKNCVRVLINREPAGVRSVARHLPSHVKASARGFRFGSDDNYRDVFVKMDCDSGVLALAEAVDPTWRQELEKGHAELESVFAAKGIVRPGPSSEAEAAVGPDDAPDTSATSSSGSGGAEAPAQPGQSESSAAEAPTADGDNGVDSKQKGGARSGGAL